MEKFTETIKSDWFVAFDGKRFKTEIGCRRYEERFFKAATAKGLTLEEYLFSLYEEETEAEFVKEMRKFEDERLDQFKEACRSLKIKKQKALEYKQSEATKRMQMICKFLNENINGVEFDDDFVNSHSLFAKSLPEQLVSFCAKSGVENFKEFFAAGILNAMNVISIYCTESEITQLQEILLSGIKK